MITGISDRSVFDAIRTRGCHVRTGDLRIRYLPKVDGDRASVPQLAYSISRKVGNAVVRNRIRRRLRSLFGEVLAEQSEAFGAAVVIVLPGAADLTYAELSEQVVKLMLKIEKSTDSAR